MKTPFFVTIVFIGVLITGSVHLVGSIESVRQWATLQELVGNIALYILVSNLLLLLAALGVLIGFWSRSKKARWFLLGYYILFLAFYWLDRLAFFQNKDFTRLPFGIGFQLLIGLFIVFGISRKSVKAYFGEINARE